MRLILFPIILVLLYGQLIYPAQKRNETVYEGGYASELSVYQGDSLTFYISTAINNLTLNIYRLGETKAPVISFPGLQGVLQPVPDSSYYYGCRWKPTLSIKIPTNWKSGIYIAEFPTANNSVNPVFFVIKERNPILRNDIVVDVSFNTMDAYNNFGGKCSYPAYSTNKKFSSHVSFLRPMNSNIYDGICRANVFSYEWKLTKWLEENRYKYDAITDVDLDRDSSYLKSCKVLIFSGHSEYWSWNMRKNVEAFIRLGGNVMFLSGNNCWWEVRYDSTYNTMICYKGTNDPGVLKTNPKSRTDKWITILRENSFTGESYEKGGQVNYGPFLRDSLGYGGYIVSNDQHWVFKGTGLKNGDIFGFRGDSSIAGYEVDGTSFKYLNGIPTVTGIDKTPSNFRILGITPANNSKRPADFPSPDLYGIIGIYKSTPGGMVFNTGTIRWVWGLYSPESKVSKITKNVLDRFLSNIYPPEIVDWKPFIVKDTVILHLPMQLSQRNIQIQYGTMQEFRINAASYNDENIIYKWGINDSVVSDGEAYLFISSAHPIGNYRIKAVAYSLTDTASIQWSLNVTAGSGIALTSKPDSILYLGQPYSFKLMSQDYFKRPVKYKIGYLPEWAKYDSINNSIFGIPNHVGKDSLSVRAFDDEGHKESRTFILQIERSRLLNFLNEIPDNYTLYQNYPNPFNNSTHISFYLIDKSDVDLNIDDVSGREVRQYILNNLSPGLNTVIWDAKSDSGENVSSGIYLYQLIVQHTSGTPVSLVKKMDYLK